MSFKSIIIIFVLLFLFIPLFAQTNFRPLLNDAFQLKGFIKEVDEDDIGRLVIPDDEKNRETIFKILRNYSLSETQSSMADELEFNPFVKLGYDVALSDAQILTRTSMLTSLSSLDVTNFAYGLTDFLIERTKTELNIAFFRKFKEEMTKEKYRDLQLLFPQTYQMLTAIGDQMYYYNNYLQGLRHAFETDLNRLPYQIRTWVETYKESIDTSIYNSIILGLVTTNSIIEKNHPGALLKDLSNELKVLKKNNDEIFRSFENIIHFGALISETFRDTLGADGYWVSSSKIRQLANDEVLLRIYLGLLYQQIKLDSNNLNIAFSEDIKLLTILDGIGANWDDNKRQVIKFMSRVTGQINSIQSTVIRFNDAKARVQANDELSSRERNHEMFNAYFDISVSLMDALRNIGLDLNEFTGGIKINEVVDSTLQTIFSKDIIRTIDTRFIENIEAAHKIGVYVFNKQYAGAVAQTFLVLNRIENNRNEEWQKFLQYGTFMANMVTADSPEAVTAAIEAVAAPLGSYSIKRHSKFSIAVNGYLGLFGGIEKLKGIDEKIAVNASITAPVGISLNRKKAGVFFSIIDLGVITNYRLNRTSDISSTPRVQLKHIVSPGVFFEYRIKESPLLLGLGGQFGPQIRDQNIIDESGDIVGKELVSGDLYWRVGISLKVDIPILYLKH